MIAKILVSILSLFLTISLFGAVKRFEQPDPVEKMIKNERSRTDRSKKALNSIVYSKNSQNHSAQTHQIDPKIPVRMPVGVSGLMFDLNNPKNFYVVANTLLKPIGYIASYFTNLAPSDFVFVPTNKIYNRQDLKKSTNFIISAGPIVDTFPKVNGGMVMGTLKF